MQLTEAVTLDRKSGGADPSRLAVEGPAVPSFPLLFRDQRRLPQMKRNMARSTQQNRKSIA
jgi:hypothetical protein